MRRAAASLLVVLVTGAGCADLVGAKFDDPSPPGAAKTCSVAATDEASLRLGSFVPSTDRYDLCLTPPGGGAPFPLVASQGAAFPGGVGYEQVAAPVRVPAGAYAAEVQPAGQGCAGPPIATASFCASAGALTLLLLEDGSQPLQVATFPETTTSSAQAQLRFVNGIGSSGSVDFGHVDAARSLTPIFSGVPFGSTAPAGSSSDGPVDANGYVSLTPPPVQEPLGVAPTGADAATLLTTPLLSATHRYTVVSTGSRTDVRFPGELVVCDETAEAQAGLTSCGGVPFDITIDSLNTFLFGPLAPEESLRRSPLIDAISKLTSDVVCLSEIDSDADKMAFTGAAAGTQHFLYSLWFPDNLDTQVDDPADQQGNVPPPPTQPACTDPAAVADLQAMFACFEANCSTTGDDTGTVIDDPTACISSHCLVPAEAFLEGAPVCWNCALAQLNTGESFRDSETACTTNPKAGLPWNGASAVLMLSRLPLSNGHQYVLPATSQRSNLVGATVNLPNGADLDVYCVQTVTPGDGVLIPYTGPYGNGQTGAAGWGQELLLETEKVVEYVQRTSGSTRRTILAGQWNAGPAVPGVVAANNSDSFAVLSAAYPLAVPPGYAAACTYCADNPIITPPGTQPNAQSAWGTYAVLANIPVTDVASAGIILKDPVIPYQGYEIPVSPFYGFSTKVHVHP